MFVEPGGALRCLDLGASVTESGALTVGTWTHVAYTHDGQTLSLYIAGQRRVTAPGAALETGNDTGTSIGGNSPSGDPFVGRIDELRIWNRARTAAEVCAAAGCVAE